MRTMVTALIASVVLGLAAAPAIAADPYEPNDSPIQATLIHGATDYNGSIDTIVDQDWYVFYSPGVQQVILSFSTATRVGWNQNVDVIAPDGSPVFRQQASSGSPFTHYLAVTQGRYYVRIYLGGTSQYELGPYVLRLVPSDRFVNQTCLDTQFRLGPAQAAVTRARSAVNKDNAAIGRDKAGMRREGRTGKGPKWHIWQRRLVADQRNLAVHKRRLTAAQHTLSVIQSSIRTNCVAL